jgi:CPA2 family monovalent cation:H+ antiporter-2
MHGSLELLKELVVIATVGVLAVVTLSRIGVPMITALLLGGALVGPGGLRLVNDPQRIEGIAEAGVVLLLFTIGLEFSVKRLARIARLVAIGGALQVGLTTVATAALLVGLGTTARQGLFFGFVISLSSTAIMLRALADRGETDAPHGRFVVGVLIAQDLLVVPMMLLVPVLAGGHGNTVLIDGGIALGRAALVVLTALTVARRTVPWLLAHVDRTRSREAFALSMMVVCMGTAWLTSLAGLSLALGAFLAGVVLADSDYAHRALGDALPLRDVFTSVFFMSLGMLFDPRLLLSAPLAVLTVFGALVFGKALFAAIACMAMRFPPSVAVASAVGLAQFGEFGFVLARVGEEARLVTPSQTRTLLAAGILSMLVTPIALRATPHLAAGARRLRALERRLVGHTPEDVPDDPPLRNHVVIVGYGVAGQMLAASLRGQGVPYTVVELNAETVRRARAHGERIVYGDIASYETLVHIGAHNAAALVLLINDPHAAERAVQSARREAPTTPIFVRTPFRANVERLRALGATEVVAGEVEAGEAMVRKVRALFITTV